MGIAYRNDGDVPRLDIEIGLGISRGKSADGAEKTQKSSRRNKWNRE
jgi:hypothetical protein